ALEEHVEEYKIECAEYPDHQCLEDKEGDHEFLYPELYRFPSGDDREQRQEGREQNKEQRDPVDPHLIGELKPAEGDPIRPLDELEVSGIGIEIDPQQQRQREVDQRRPKRDITGIARDDALLTARHEDERSTDKRHEGDERQKGPIAHD